MLILFTTFILFFTSACSNNDDTGELAPDNAATDVYISAASSLQNVLNDIKETFEEEHPNVNIIYNFGSSGALKQQISQGAPIDLYFSASSDLFHELVKENRISENHSSFIIGNELVLIQPKSSASSFEDMEAVLSSDVRRIAIGTPEIVPAGQFAKEALENLDLWVKVQDKLINAQNVRQVLTFVESGNADLGFVYKTDAFQSDRVGIITTIDHTLHDPIMYPLGIIKESAEKSEVITVYHYFQSKEAQEIFERYGFNPVLD